MIITIPLPPMPQSRPRFSSRGGFTKAYEEKAMTDYKKSVAFYAKSRKTEYFEKGPVGIVVRFYIYPPKYLANGEKRQEALENELIYVDKKPDLDNYFKAVTDAINGICYKDDGQIVTFAGQKLYSYNPRTEIEIFRLGDKK